jgi:hypothetical protein
MTEYAKSLVVSEKVAKHVEKNPSVAKTNECLLKYGLSLRLSKQTKLPISAIVSFLINWSVGEVARQEPCADRL